MSQYACTILLLADAEKEFSKTLRESLEDRVFDFYCLKPDIDLSAPIFSFLPEPVYMIVDLEKIDQYRPIITSLKTTQRGSRMIGVGSMFKMSNLLAVSALGIDSFVDNTRSEHIILKKILNRLPEIAPTVPGPLDQADEDAPPIEHFEGKFLADQSAAIQEFLHYLHKFKYARQWVVVGVPGSEFSFVTKEIVHIASMCFDLMHYPSLQGESEASNAISCYLPEHEYDLSKLPEGFTIRCIHRDDFLELDEVHGGWVVAHLPSLLKRPSDKVHYLKKWLPSIEQMNLSDKITRHFNREAVEGLLCDVDVDSFQALWNWMEQFVLKVGHQVELDETEDRFDETNPMIDEWIRKTYRNIVQQTIKHEDLDLLLDELEYTEL